jgi:trehalose 6-phosphate phosphatase
VVLCDFDGTLAPIVEDPTAARAHPGALEALCGLVGRYGRVGVVSGRPVAFLRERLGDQGLFLSGLYGLEWEEDGRRRELDEVVAWRTVVAGSAARAAAELPVLVEDKGLSLTLHFRTRPAEGPPTRAWAAAEAARTGLEVRPAKASVELHPPVPVDKGTVVRTACRGMRSACFVGDDVGDLPAFDALDELAAAGLAVVRVAVATEDAPAEVLDRADVVADGPSGVAALLRTL